MSAPDLFDLLADDETAPLVTLTDTDLGVVAEATWPDLRGTGSTDATASHNARFPERVACVRMADLLREHCPGVEVWWDSGCGYLAVRQMRGPDLVLLPGDTVRIVAGEVTR